jgi:uncharacterized membrane protein YeaQ/YmgE (transglycosylase-associated protein family)
MNNNNDKIINKNKWKMFYDSLKKNYLLTICLIIQIFAFSILYPSNPTFGMIINIILGIVTFIIGTILGYCVHVLSHLFNFKEIFETYYKSSNTFGHLLRKLPKSIMWLLYKIIYLLDFHDKIHHNTNINSNWKNIIIETLMNLYTEGIALIIFLKLLDFGVQLRGQIYKLNYPILFAWSILYTTIHNINYKIITPICHIQHHKDKNTNYGIDFMDIIFETKYDNNSEEMNHGALNVILIMLLIIFLKDLYKPKNILMKFFYNSINWLVTN